MRNRAKRARGRVRAVFFTLLVSALLLGLAVVGVNVFAPGSWFARAAPVCPAAEPIMVGKISVPAGPIAGYCQDRLVNAAHIMNAARAYGIGTRTQTVGVMTAMGESGLEVLDHGDAAGPDSRGLFQQRDNGAWGTLADRMDPVISASNFFKKLVTVPGWQTMTPTTIAHIVQVNQDSQHYAPYWDDAQIVVGALSK
ncbi:MAG: hypothetical protein H7248_09905 [Microbacteriaceae bacterium]|nr:hypothetical protein [Microbacteriaceae bacterium]